MAEKVEENGLCIVCDEAPAPTGNLCLGCEAEINHSREQIGQGKSITLDELIVKLGLEPIN